MERHRLNAVQAFRLPGSVSRHENCRQREVADLLTVTGHLPDRPARLRHRASQRAGRAPPERGEHRRTR